MKVMAETNLTVTGTLIGVPIIYYLFKLIYRVIFHPLAAFPGPKLAALTFKYEYYYDGLKDGRFTEQISRMHDKYGQKYLPIYRITDHNVYQVLLSVLILTSCIATTQISSTKSTQARVEGGTKTRIL